MHSCDQRKQFAEPSMMLDKNPIKVVTDTKFLGVVFDRILSNKSHVDFLKTNCLKALNILKVVGHTDLGADRKTPLCLCQALVRSKLDYGCIVYGAASKHVLQKLDPIHHDGLQTALGAFCTSPVSSLYAKAQEVSSKNRRKKTVYELCSKTKYLS